MTKQELTAVVNQLITLGEDQDELNYWLDIYDDLEPDKQAEIAANLQEELAELK